MIMEVDMISNHKLLDFSDKTAIVPSVGRNRIWDILGSDISYYMTGSQIVVDGGVLLS